MNKKIPIIGLIIGTIFFIIGMYMFFYHVSEIVGGSYDTKIVISYPLRAYSIIPFSLFILNVLWTTLYLQKHQNEEDKTKEENN